MLWYKAWLETRWRFYAGLALLIGLSATIVLVQPLISKMIQSVPDPDGQIGQWVREALSSHPAYIWSQWFGKNLLQIWMLLAILLGVGGIVTESAHGTALFTLSLPVTRRRLLGVRAVTGTIELVILAVVPSLFIPVVSRLRGTTYPVTDAVVYGLLLVGGGLVFFTFSFLLATLFSDQLKPITIGLGVAFLLGLLPWLIKELAPYNVYRLMSGETYFLKGTVPWMGLAISLAGAVALFYLSVWTVERRDF